MRKNGLSGALLGVALSVGVMLTGLSLLPSANAQQQSVPVPAGSAPAADGASAPQQPGMLSMMMPFALIMGVMYFMVYRPQQKKMKEQQDMLGALQHGDEVITAAGILGTVTGIADKVVTLEVARDVKIKMLKSQVTQILKGPLKDAQT